MSRLVRTPGTCARRATRPPQLSTSFHPTIRSSVQSPPFAMTSGRSVRIRERGVAPRNCITQSTHSSAASTSIRWRTGLRGRPGPFSARTLASALTATTSRSPRRRACSRLRTCPMWSRSKQPFVKTTRSCRRCAARTSRVAWAWLSSLLRARRGVTSRSCQPHREPGAETGRSRAGPMDLALAISAPHRAPASSGLHGSRCR